MQINTKLDFDLVAVENEDTLHILLELTAPTPACAAKRPPATLQVVLDRSGSMADGRLHAALLAIDRLLLRLRPEDRFGLVVFDDEVQVAVPTGKVGDANHARSALRHVHPGGMTDLASGYLRGIQEAQRAMGEGETATLVLLSDGHANIGITDIPRLEQFASGAQQARVSSSTVGIGLGYDEDLLASIARGGSGNNHFAESGDDAGAALASEVDGLFDESIQAASLTIRPSDDVEAVRIYNDLPASEIEGGFVVELGNLHAAEQRRLIIQAEVPAISSVGLARICDLELRWVDVETMSSERVDLPVYVNVVPGDEAAGRTENPEVTTELSFQRAQRTKREATDALRDGDLDRAKGLWREASEDLRRVDLEDVPGSVSAEIANEVRILEELADRASEDALTTRKRALADHHMKTRKRGR